MTQDHQQRYYQQKYASNQSTNIDQNSYCTLGPTNSFQTSFCTLSAKYKNFNNKKPAFGTKQIRQTKQLNGNKQSDIIAYSGINYQKNEKYCDRYENLATKNVPFLSGSLRFSLSNVSSPGPGNYDLPQLKNGLDKKNKKSYGAMYCPFKRIQTKNDEACYQKYSRQKCIKNDFRQLSYINPLQNISQNYQLQQKIKKKRQQAKQKFLKLKQIMHDSRRTNIQPLIKNNNKKSRSSYKQNLHTSSPCCQNKQNIQRKKLITCKQNNKKPLNLQKLTSQFLPKNDFNFERQEYGTGTKIQNFKQTHNYHPIFIEKQNQNLFSSYINMRQGPGPGHYQKKNKKHPRKQSYMMNKLFN